MSLLDKVAECIRIGVGVARRKTLVRHVEQREVTTSLDGIADRPPLLGGGVDTSGVVRASMEKEDGAGGSILDIPQKPVDIKTDGLPVVVAVVLDVQSAGTEDGLVVCP